MKFRIHDNHVRVRLTRGEVASLGAGKRIEQTTRFSSTVRLVCSVQPLAETATASASFDGTNLAVILPLAETVRWANSEQVGITATQAVDQEHILRLLVEKDFECLHKDDEHTPDAYPNPRLQ